MFYLVYILFGITPSLIWLSFYLRKDAHPEPKKTVLKIFFLGMGAAIGAFLIETPMIMMLLGLSKLKGLKTLIQAISIVYASWGVALIEEFLKYVSIEKKYMVLKNGVIREPECDEPLDLMLYMVISALGFAALENLLILYLQNLPFLETLLVSSLRFIGATFLHALCSGTLGFFLALSFLNHKRRFYFFTTGITIATLLHGTFNYSIMKIEASLMTFQGKLVVINSRLFGSALASLVLVLVSLGLFVSWGFWRLKKIKSICKIG